MVVRTPSVKNVYCGQALDHIEETFLHEYLALCLKLRHAKFQRSSAREHFQIWVE